MRGPCFFCHVSPLELNVRRHDTCFVSGCSRAHRRTPRGQIKEFREEHDATASPMLPPIWEVRFYRQHDHEAMGPPVFRACVRVKLRGDNTSKPG